MGFWDFFKREKKLNVDKVEKSDPSPEQAFFADTVTDIIEPTLERFGFVRRRKVIRKYSVSLLWRKGRQYIKVESTSYPTDFPYYYNIVLGEGDSEELFENDFESVPLWRIKARLSPEVKACEYDFPLGDQVRPSVDNANDELLMYAEAFLKGDLSLFRTALSEQNERFKD